MTESVPDLPADVADRLRRLVEAAADRRRARIARGEPEPEWTMTWWDLRQNLIEQTCLTFHLATQVTQGLSSLLDVRECPEPIANAVVRIYRAFDSTATAAGVGAPLIALLDAVGARRCNVNGQIIANLPTSPGEEA